MQHQTIKYPGFLLIELMVAITIIGLLIAAGAVSLSRAQRSSRDAQRAGDGLTIKRALDSYAAANRGLYPITGTACVSTHASILSAYIGAKQQGNFPADPRMVAGSTSCATGDYSYLEATVLGVSNSYRYRLQIAFEDSRPQGEISYTEPTSTGSRVRYWLNGPGK